MPSCADIIFTDSIYTKSDTFSSRINSGIMSGYLFLMWLYLRTLTGHSNGELLQSGIDLFFSEFSIAEQMDLRYNMFW